MKIKGTQVSEVATAATPRPADFPIGSPRSRAAARKLAEEREAGATQDWITVTMGDGDLKRARVFAKKLRNSDTANPFKVHLIVRTHKTRKQAQAVRNQPLPWNKVSLAVDENEALRLAPLFAERNGGGAIVYVDVVVNDKG